MNNSFKELPAAVELEVQVLGAMLIDSNALDEAFSVLFDASVFSITKHVLIFKAMQDLYELSEGIDLLTVSNKLRTKNELETVGGEVYLIECSQRIASGAHIEYHARILLQHYVKRRIILVSQTLIAKAYDEETDSLKLLDTASDFIASISENTMSGKKQLTFPESLQKLRENVVRLTNSDAEELSGVDTGFAKVNDLTGGWQPNDLVIIAARPGMGKTSLIARGVLINGKQNVPVGIISLEMSTVQLTTRLVANNTHWHLNQLFRNGFEKTEYMHSFNKQTAEMESYPIYFNDTPFQDIKDVMAQARVWKKQHDVQIIYIDYLQLIKDRTKKHNREQEIASITANLKGLAKELNIPIIALAQLSREVEKRGGDKRPKLSDLRESGAIEQDADVIAFLWRPEYYGIEIPDYLKDLNANTLMDFAKHRNGSVEEKGLFFIENKTKFIDPSIETIPDNAFDIPYEAMIKANELNSVSF